MKPGDVIEFDYELFVEGHDGLFDTTLAEKAEQAGIAREGAYFAPMRYVVGAGRLIPGLEQALLTAEPGKTFTVEVPPEQGYGARDPAKVETVAIAEFRKAKIDPKPGLGITWRGRRGLVLRVGGGRVRVDFNPALAGKHLKYIATVRKVYADPAGRVEGLFLMNYPAPEAPKVSVEDHVAIVELPGVSRFDPNWPHAKMGVLASLLEHTDLAAVRFVEEHLLRPKTAEPAEAPPPPLEG